MASYDPPRRDGSHSSYWQPTDTLPAAWPGAVNERGKRSGHGEDVRPTDRVNAMTMKVALVEGAHTALMLGAGADEYVPDRIEDRYLLGDERPWGATSFPAKRDWQDRSGGCTASYQRSVDRWPSDPPRCPSLNRSRPPLQRVAVVLSGGGALGPAARPAQLLLGHAHLFSDRGFRELVTSAPDFDLGPYPPRPG